MDRLNQRDVAKSSPLQHSEMYKRRQQSKQYVESPSDMIKMMFERKRLENRQQQASRMDKSAQYLDGFQQFQPDRESLRGSIKVAKQSGDSLEFEDPAIESDEEEVDASGT